jgi:hypothetical protein
VAEAHKTFDDSEIAFLPLSMSSGWRREADREASRVDESRPQAPINEKKPTESSSGGARTANPFTVSIGAVVEQ